MRATHHLEAIVLHTRSFGEAHRIIELLTAEQGRVVAVARHARRSKRRFAGALEVFSTIRAELATSTGLWRLDSAELISARLPLREHLASFERAGKFCEAVRLLIAEHQAASEIYTWLADALDALAAGDMVDAVRFYPRLLLAAGIAPDLRACVSCGRALTTIAELNARGGGALCSSCARSHHVLPSGVVNALSGGACTDAACADAVETCALDWVEGHVGKALRTRRIDLQSG